MDKHAVAGIMITKTVPVQSTFTLVTTRLLRLLSLPRQRQALLLSAAWALTVARWKVKRWPFAKLSAQLGTLVADASAAPLHTGIAAPPTEAQPLGFVDDLRWAVGVASRHLPWKPSCLMQAVAAQQLLRRQGQGCDLYFGVRPGAEAGAAAARESLSAHAWLRSGADWITGEREAHRFQVIAVYRSQPTEGHAP